MPVAYKPLRTLLMMRHHGNIRHAVREVPGFLIIKLMRARKEEKRAEAHPCRLRRLIHRVRRGRLRPLRSEAKQGT